MSQRNKIDFREKTGYELNKNVRINKTYKRSKYNNYNYIYRF